MAYIPVELGYGVTVGHSDGANPVTVEAPHFEDQNLTELLGKPLLINAFAVKIGSGGGQFPTVIDNTVEIDVGVPIAARVTFTPPDSDTRRFYVIFLRKSPPSEFVG